jgi:hypothetical protein
VLDCSAADGDDDGGDDGSGGDDGGGGDEDGGGGGDGDGGGDEEAISLGAVVDLRLLSDRKEERALSNELYTY